MYKGELEGFPVEVVDKMLERQFEQTGKKDVSVFENKISANDDDGGFYWGKTMEGYSWWHDVITSRDFPKFYERYPKQNTMDIKTLVQKLLAADPSKEAELRKIYPEVFGYDLMSLARKDEDSAWHVFGNNSEETPCIGIITVECEQCFHLDENHIWEIKKGYQLHVKPRR